MYNSRSWSLSYIISYSIVLPLKFPCSTYYLFPPYLLHPKLLTTTDIFADYSFTFYRLAYNWDHLLDRLSNRYAESPLSVLLTSFVVVVVVVKVIFLYMYVPMLFIWSPKIGYLGCFQFLSIINKVAIKICAQVFLWT